MGLLSSQFVVSAIETIKNTDVAEENKDAKLASPLDINEHHQNEAFEDKDHDMIEDLSVDKELEAAEKKESAQDKQKQSMPGGMPPGLSDIMNAFGMGGGPPSSKMGNSFIEEKTDANGHHTTKKVTKGDGWEQVEIQTDGPLDIGSLIGQMMQEQMQAMNSMRQGMIQHSSSGPFSMPPPMILDMHDDLMDDEHEEDPFEVISQIEKNKRQPGFLTSSQPFVDPVAEDHQIELVEESPVNTASTDTYTQNSVHNDGAAHSPLYIFMCIILVAAIGFFLWYSKHANALLGKKKGQQADNRKDIGLSSFNKRQ